MNKKILYLTNLKNQDPEEDLFLIEQLKKYCDIIHSHPLECEKHLTSVEGVIIRNIWPTYEYLAEWKRIKKLIQDSELPTYNPLTGKGDNGGKDYLIDLYKNNFPVIPSVDKIEDINLLPDSAYYWIKPKESCDGYGAEKISKEYLLKKKLTDFIIQPYIEFVSEPSFFFIDNKFSYAIEMPNRLKDRDMKLYEPTEYDFVFAQKFVEWNNLLKGIQRIDAIRLKTGELLLTEVEDISEYLYILDIKEGKRNEILSQLIQSIRTNLNI